MISILKDAELEAFLVEQLKNPNRLHQTVGVYNDGTYKTNGVDSHDLRSHVTYNLAFRPGRAFFVNGTCLNYGLLGAEVCAVWAARIQSMPLPQERTVPYH